MKQQANILVVDDNTLILMSIERMLREHDVTTAASGAEAMEMLAERQFDIILCDLVMPKMNGVEVFKSIRDSYPGLESSVIFMTGGVTSAKVRVFLDGIDNVCVNKPFTAQEARSFVHHHLQSNLKQ